MYIGMMNHPDFSKYDVSSVRGAWSGGAAAPVEVAQKITEVFGCRFMSGYGTTECAGNHFTYPDNPVEVACSTVGPPLDTTEAKIIGKNGRIVPVGVPGEVCARGATRLLGYYKNPEVNTRDIDDRGWFHSGDLGVINENGYIQMHVHLSDGDINDRLIDFYVEKKKCPENLPRRKLGKLWRNLHRWSEGQEKPALTWWNLTPILPI